MLSDLKTNFFDKLTPIKEEANSKEQEGDSINLIDDEKNRKFESSVTDFTKSEFNSKCSLQTKED